MFDFHGPGPVCLVLAMTSCIYVVCMSPAREIYSEASHLPSDPMTRSRPLIGQPSSPPTPTQLVEPRKKEFFRIGLVDRPTHGPHSWLRIVDPTHSPNLFSRLVNPSCGAWKTNCTHGLSTHGICFNCGSSLYRALQTGRCSKSDQNILFTFLTQCHYPHLSR